MSVHLVSNSKISYIAVYFMRFAPEEWKRELKELFSVDDARSLGALLWQLNAAAVDERYGKGEHRLFNPHGYRYLEPAFAPTAMPSYKVMMEWLYQVEGSEASEHRLVEMIKQCAFDTAFEIIARTQDYREARVV
ncbi:MAG: hypothetical protein D6690_05335 [Nitrospirae bacterium]|nr:MAG: hypothetical protein D6690_05335 [Nitrospirota bacterium]